MLFMENTSSSYPAQQQQMPQFQTTPPLLNMIDWLLELPSVPLSLKNQFFMLWELPVFSNLDAMDIQRLLLKFKEWTILFKWYIPDRCWCNVQSFSDTVKVNSQSSKTVKLEMDLNMLFNLLYQAYYMQLTRGKNGFTVREMTSVRQIIKGENEEEKKKKWTLF